jgi:cytochrome c oxidase subunit 3
MEDTHARIPTTPVPAGAEHDGHAGHDKNLAHHFESHAQQFSAGKLGMWLFLVQEILFFSGLFCAYAIYRSNHPEIFAYADHFLDRKLGALNTCVLLLSSFTMAWAVRAAQTNQRRLTTALLAITILCACGFLGVKVIEYHHKFADGLLWGKNYKPTAEALEMVESHAEPHGAMAIPRGGHGPGVGDTKAKMMDMGGVHDVHPSRPPADLSTMHQPQNVHIFFGIYFAMTGLHAVHIILGIGVLMWIMWRSHRGDFSSKYYAPVEYTGLYWHLVDLVWIYLFPLLYLIH